MRGTCIVAAAITAAAVAATAPAAGAGVPPLDWTDCGGGVQCATAIVPVDHDQPNGGKLRLALARRPATGDPAQKIGSLFFNPGGPGGSGVDQIRNDVGPGTLNERFDLVGFDPRGVGLSRPAIDCISDRELERQLAAIPSPRQGNLRRFMATGARTAAGCWRRTPRALLNHVSTTDAARDLDLLREAVGDERLSYLGASYGTELGAQYATLFPRRVRALVLDGGVDHREVVGDPLGFSVTYARGNEAALGRFFAFCREQPGDCPFVGGGDPRPSFDALVARLERDPLPPTSSDRRVVDGSLTTLAALVAMYDPIAWRPLAVGLAQARDGNGAVLRALANNLSGRRPDGTYTNFLEANLVITANDSRTPSRLSAYARHLRRLRSLAPHFAAGSFTLDAPRRGLPPGEDAYFGPVRYPAGRPTLLVIGSTGDNATPYPGARAMTRQLGNARLLTREGNGHTAFGLSSCVAGHARAYLIDGVLPPAGTTCLSD